MAWSDGIGGAGTLELGSELIREVVVWVVEVAKVGVATTVATATELETVVLCSAIDDVAMVVVEAAVVVVALVVAFRARLRDEKESSSEELLGFSWR